MNEPKCISSSTIADAGWFSLKRDTITLPNNQTLDYNYVHKRDFALTIPILQSGEFVMVEQYRYPVKAVTLEFPKGSANPNEQLIDCAKRELSEETGYQAKNIKSLGQYYLAPGIMDQSFEVFLATNLIPGKQNLDASEQGLTVKLIKSSNIESLIQNQTIKDIETITSYFIYKLQSPAI